MHLLPVICFIFFVICTPCIFIMLFLLLFCFLCLLCQIHTPTVGVFYQNFIYYLSLFLLIPHSYLFVVVINIGLIVILFIGIYFICHCQDNLLFVIFHNDCKNNMVCKSVVFFPCQLLVLVDFTMLTCFVLLFSLLLLTSRCPCM